MLCALAGLLGACATPPTQGEALSVPAGSPGYRFSAAATGRRDDDLLLLVTLSGGGNRAAAMAYGALTQLASDPVQREGVPVRLLDQVDVVSTVSGGSIVGAYYVLHGDGLFQRFLPDYLYRDAQSSLLGSMAFSPLTWMRLASPRYARGDLFADYLERRLFHGATFADLAQQVDRPFLVINTTDLSAGGRFEFTQDWFDMICTDLSRFPVSRAVVASSALPVLVTPITVRNRAGRCGFQPSQSLRQMLGSPDGSERATELGRRVMAYQHGGQLAFLHLADGAMSDNLGIRPAIDALLLARDLAGVRERFGLRQIRRVAVISVDAAIDPQARVAESARAPSAMTSATLASAVLVEEVGRENRALLRDLLRQLSSTSEGAPGIETYWIDVTLAGIADAPRRERLRAVPTNLGISRQLVDELVCSARELLTQSSEYRRLLQDLGGAPASYGCEDMHHY